MTVSVGSKTAGGSLVCREPRPEEGKELDTSPGKASAAVQGAAPRGEE